MKSCIPVEYVLAVYPRACGDNHVGVRAKSPVHGPPPRVRGQWPYAPGFPRAWRSTPARAGTMIGDDIVSSTGTVHPRACGDNFSVAAGIGLQVGPPPRVRGQ